jgi:hypothetical protein
VETAEPVRTKKKTVFVGMAVETDSAGSAMLEDRVLAINEYVAAPVPPPPPDTTPSLEQRQAIHTQTAVPQPTSAATTSPSSAWGSSWGKAQWGGGKIVPPIPTVDVVSGEPRHLSMKAEPLNFNVTLNEAWRPSRRATPSRKLVVNIRKNSDQLLAQAAFLAQLARSEIEKLDSTPKNDPSSIDEQNRQRELLLTFAEGFEQIADALAEYSTNRADRRLLRKATKTVDRIAAEAVALWEMNAAYSVATAVQIPAIGLGYITLASFGMPSTCAAMISAAMIGGDKIGAIVKAMKE